MDSETFVKYKVTDLAIAHGQVGNLRAGLLRLQRSLVEHELDDFVHVVQEIAEEVDFLEKVLPSLPPDAFPF